MRRLVASLAIGLLTIVIGAGPVAGQEVEPVDGAADFRTAPQLADGSYSVEIVTGEVVWFSVLYENNTFPVRIVPEVVDPLPGVGATAILMFPNLNVATEDPTFERDGGRLSYGNGANIWYVGIRLTAEDGSQGLLHTVRFELEGFLGADSAPCEAGECDLIDDLDDIQSEIDRLQEIIDGGGSTDEDQEEELAAIEAELASADTDIREICGGDRCTEVASTSSVPWLVVGLLAVAAIALVAFGLRRPTAPEPPAEEAVR